MGFSSKQLTRSSAMFVAFATFACAAMPLAIAQEKLAPGAVPAAVGNVSQPAVVLSIASLDKLQEDVNYITAAVGQGGYGGMFAGMSAMFTQGMDTARPIGVVVSMVGDSPEPAFLIPTDDAKTMLKRLEPQIGPADELSDGTLAINAMGQLVYVKQNANWAVVARNKDLLSSLSTNPAALMAGMGNDYDLAFRLKMQLVPVNLRAMLTSNMRQGFEQAMESSAEQSGMDSAAYAESTMKQFEMLIEDTDELFFGINTDITGKRLVVDTRFSAVEGSDFAKMYGGQRSIPSRFASVIRPDAAAYFHGATSIGPELVKQTRESVGGTIDMVKNAMQQSGDMSEESAAEINEMIDRVVKLLVDSIAEGRSDGGAILMADANQLQFVYGAFIADGNEAAQIVKDLAAKLQDVPDSPTFQFDVADYNGVTMHLVKAAVPAEADEARKVFGDTAKIHIGTAPKALYIAIGDASVPLLKDLIDSGNADNGGNRPISQVKIRLLPILTYAKSIESNEAIDAMIAALRDANAEGVVTLVGDTIPNGQQGRFTIGEGVLKMIGGAVQAVQQKQRAAQQDF